MPGPLSSLRVLDFSTLLPGPCATLLLADMGADVLRVEAPGRVDLTRVMPPHASGMGTAHAWLNRGKRSLALDLKLPASVGIVKQLIPDFDIVVEQFRPGVMARLGLDYAALSAINPRLIYCSITGYGQTGPWRNRAGHDINYLALSGVASHCGRKAGGPPPLGIQVADVAGGSHHAVMGILAAVIHRQQTGEGQWIDISMTDAAFALNGMAGAACLAGGDQRVPEGDALNGGSFYDYYQTQDGRWLSVGGLESQFLERFCRLIGRPELSRIGLSPVPEHQQMLKTAFSEAVASRSFAEWQNLLADVDACVEPVLSLAEAAEHPQLQARAMVIEVPVVGGGSQRQLGFPIKFSRTPCATGFAGGALGADTASILSGLSGLSDEAADR